MFQRSLSLIVATTITFGLFAVADVAHADQSATYVVQPGDSLYGIARHEGISVAALLAANGLTIDSVILPGQRLELPGVATPDDASTAAPAGSTHRIVAGDSLSGIASRYGVSLAALLTANSLRIDGVILPGQQLVVPGGTAPAAPAAPAAPVAADPAPPASVHKIVPGDSLSGIASAYRVRLPALLAENALTIDSVILPGRLLRLPAGAVTPTVEAEPAEPAEPAVAPAAPQVLRHTVVGGNSLSGIAATYGVRLADLLATNGMSIDSVILPGQVLELPAGATPPAAPAPAAPPAAPAAGSPSGGAAVPDTGNARIDAVVAFALAQVGKDYAFFTRGPDAFDCSGLTLAAYAEAGISLVHYSAAQALQGTRVDLDHDTIRAGDLIFQQRRGSMVINHVGIAIDDRRWVQAVGTGYGVRVGSIPELSTITEVRRFIDG